MKKILIVLGSIGLLASSIMFLIYRSLYHHCGRSKKVDYQEIRSNNDRLLMQRHSVESVRFMTEDGLSLAGTLVKRSHARRILLICHGRWQAKEYFYSLADLFPEDTLFFFDFRTHGDSEGNVVSLGYHESRDVKAALLFLGMQHTTPILPIYGIGFSMGAVALLKAAYEGSKFDGLVLDSAFAHLRTQLCRSFERTTHLPSCLRGLSQCLYEVLIRGSIEKVNARTFIHSTMPVLIIHSYDDKIVPIEDAFILYRQAQGYKELWAVKGPWHAAIYRNYPQAFVRTIITFFASVESLQH
jgi:uncharacterized protein